MTFPSALTTGPPEFPGVHPAVDLNLPDDAVLLTQAGDGRFAHGKVLAESLPEREAEYEHFLRLGNVLGRDDLQARGELRASDAEQREVAAAIDPQEGSRQRTAIGLAALHRGDHLDRRPAIRIEHPDHMCVREDDPRLIGEEPAPFRGAAIGQRNLKVDGGFLHLLQDSRIQRWIIGVGR